MGVQTDASRPASAPASLTRPDVLALLLVLVVGGIARFAMPTVIGWSQDQSDVATLALDLVEGKRVPLLGLRSSAGLPHSPFFFYVPAIGYLFSRDPVVVTMFVSALNLSGVVGLWFLTRRYFGRRAALAASLAYAVNPWVVGFSRTIWASDHRAPLFIGAVAVGFLGFVEGRRWAQVAFGPLLMAAVQTHYSGWTLLPAAAWLVFMGKRPSIRVATAGLLLSMVVLLPFVITLLSYLGQHAAQAVHPQARSLSIREFIKPLGQFAWIVTGVGSEQYEARVFAQQLLARVRWTAPLWWLQGLLLITGWFVVWRRSAPVVAGTITLWTTVTVHSTGRCGAPLRLVARPTSRCATLPDVCSSGNPDSRCGRQRMSRRPRADRGHVSGRTRPSAGVGRTCPNRTGTSSRRSYAVKAVWTLALVGLLATPVAAQQADPWTVERDPSEGSMFRAGTLAWTPAVVLAGGHDSNIAGTPDSIGDYQTYAVPQMDLWWVHPGVAVNVFGAMEFVRLGSNPGFINGQQGISVQRRHALVRPYAGFTYRQTEAAVQGYEVGFRSARKSGNYIAGTKILLTPRSEVEVNLRVDLTSWAADARYQGSSLREKLNRNASGVTTSYTYRITPLTSVGARVEATRDRFRYSPLRDGQTIRAFSVLGFERPALLFGSVAAGYAQFHSPSSGAADFHGPVAVVNLGLGKPAGTLLRAYLTRDTDYSFDTSLAYYVVTGSTLVLSRRVGRQWDLEAYGSRFTLDYRPAQTRASVGRYDVLVEVGAVAAYRLGTWTRMGVSGERAKKTGPWGYQADRLMAFFMVGSGRFQRLDRPTQFER